MSEKEHFKPLAKNIISVTVSHFLLKIVSAIISIVIARYLGVKELGYYATAVSFAGFTGIITNIGLRDLLIKNISTNRENIKEYISSAIFLQFILSLSVYLLMIFLTNFLNYEPIVIRLIYIGGAAAFLTDIIEFLFAYYYGIQRMGKIVFFRFIYSISIISLICAVIYYNKGLITITIANLTVATFVTTVLLASIINETGFKIKIDLFLALLKDALPFGLNIIFNIAYTRIGLVLLSLSAGAYTVGLYDSSLKVITMLGIIPNIILTALYPVLFRLGKTPLKTALFPEIPKVVPLKGPLIQSTELTHSGEGLMPNSELSNSQDYRQIFFLALRCLSFIGFPVSVFLFIYSKEIITLIYGKTFMEAGFILKILSLIFAFQCISYPLSDALTTSNKQMVRTRITGTAFIITLLGNIIFIPLAGALGTAFVTLFVELLFLVVLLYYVKNLIFSISIFDLAGKQIFSSVLMGFWLYALYINEFHNLLAGFLSGVFIYVTISGLVNLRFIRSVLKR